MKESFGQYIHDLRLKSGFTLTKLAAALDIDQSTLSKIENRKRSIPLEILPKLADVFNLDIQNLRKEYYSEKIAEIIYSEKNSKDLLKMAEEKAKYFRNQKSYQSIIKF